MMPFGKYSLEIQACWEKAVILWLYICRLWVLCIVKRLRKQDRDSIMKYVNFHRQPSSQAMPIWKWSVELVLGFLLFVFLYGCGGVDALIPWPYAKIGVCLLSSVGMLVLFLSWTRLFEKRWRWEWVSRKNIRLLPQGFLLGASLFVILTAVLALARCYEASFHSPRWFSIIYWLFYFLYVACSEELIFRGILFRMIDERFGLWWALAVSALLFGFAHFFQPNATVWSSVAIAIEAGVLLGVAFKYSGSLWLPIGIHWAWNFTQGNVFGFSVSGSAKTASVFDPMVCGPELITGGAFGPEASVITVVLCSLLALFMLVRLGGKRNSQAAR